MSFFFLFLLIFFTFDFGKFEIKLFQASMAVCFTEFFPYLIEFTWVRNREPLEEFLVLIELFEV